MAPKQKKQFSTATGQGMVAKIPCVKKRDQKQNVRAIVPFWVNDRYPLGECKSLLIIISQSVRICYP